ncbi:hypothetical protein [Salinisphaera sp. G21_0]|uniref:hypothetical protein n=1 Tax=Salinisphaera sp. G21_0 TaxID=2821094 RepID=UPI001ADA0BC3|nr:hypothetical protein [Salinisphaera sp. G21_0]MBO9484299.1 hypothetical protein [Salinisphaera sp. G21_0]
MSPFEQKIFDLVRDELTDDLIPDNFSGRVDSRYCGHCHHASLAMYNLLGGKNNGYKLQKAEDEKGITHYWLINSYSEVIDPTVEQYTHLNRPLPYQNLKDNRASYRKTNTTKLIIKRVKEKLKNR